MRRNPPTWWRHGDVTVTQSLQGKWTTWAVCSFRWISCVIISASFIKYLQWKYYTLTEFCTGDKSWSSPSMTQRVLYIYGGSPKIWRGAQHAQRRVNIARTNLVLRLHACVLVFGIFIINIRNFATESKRTSFLTSSATHIARCTCAVGAVSAYARVLADASTRVHVRLSRRHEMS